MLTTRYSIPRSRAGRAGLIRRMDETRGHRWGRTRATWLLVAMIGVIGVQEVHGEGSDSKAVSNSADFFAANSWWQSERVFLGRVAPVGFWSLENKHWFGVGAAPPWAVWALPAKPAAGVWDTVANIVSSRTTVAASGSFAKSEWEIDPYTGFLVGGFYAKYWTRSQANASAATVRSSSETRIRDPWVIPSPATDPNWDPKDPLDPEGKWELGGHISLFGELTLQDVVNHDAEINLSYSVALNSTEPDDATEVLSISVTPDGSDVVSNPPVGVEMLLFSGNHGFAKLVTPEGLEAILDGFLTPTGWGIDPSFDFGEFQPDMDSQLDEIFSMFMFLRLESDIQTATVFTEVSTSLSVPEPASVVLLTLGGLMRTRRRRR